MNLPKKGDILYVKRFLYEHYGIYIGGGRVVHFAANEGAETNAAQADIHETTVSDFLKGGELYILKDSAGFSPLPPDEIVQRAKSKVGKCKGEYNLVSNNCEHFAYWCRYGESYSRQVENVADVVTSVGFVPLMILTLIEKIIGFGNDKNLSDENSLLAIAEEVELLKFADVISFFKETKRLDLLRNSPDLIAVSIREKMDDGRQFVVCCLFNKATNEIGNLENVKSYIAKKIDEDFTSAFGDKPMVVLN